MQIIYMLLMLMFVGCFMAYMVHAHYISFLMWVYASISACSFFLMFKVMFEYIPIVMAAL